MTAGTTPSAVAAPAASPTPPATSAPTATPLPLPARTPTPAAAPTAAGGFKQGYFPVPLWSLDLAQWQAQLPGQYNSAHLTIHYRPGSFAGAVIDDFARDAEAAIAHIEALLAVTWTARTDDYLAYTFFSPPDQGVRGFTRSSAHVILQLYDHSGTPLERQYFTAHELTHQIAGDTIGWPASTMLSEGLAMYAGQQYLLDNGDISLDGLARAALDTGQLVPITALATGGVTFGGRFFSRRAYDESGSFVQFLIVTYGLAPFKQVYTSGDYLGVYGATLLTLQNAWEAYLRSPRATGPFAANSARFMQDIEAVQSAYNDLFTALSDGRRVPLTLYHALDAARIAADRGLSAVARQKLLEFSSGQLP